MYNPENSELPPCNQTYRISKVFQQSKNDEISKHISWETIHYITKKVRQLMPNKVCPLSIPGDGNCLLHSISVSLWGSEEYHILLRKKLTEELKNYKDFYTKAVDKALEDEEEQGYKDPEYMAFMDQAEKVNSHLGFVHIFALSNIIQRPIIIYADDTSIEMWGAHEEGCAGTFLPTRHGAKSCKGGPIALSWSNDLMNHYVPLCPFEGESFEWPLLPLVYKKTLSNGESIQDYLKHGKMSEEQTIEVNNNDEIEMRENIPFFQLLETLKRLHEKQEEQKKQTEKALKTLLPLMLTSNLISQIKQLQESNDTEEEEEYDVVVRIDLTDENQTVRAYYIGLNFDDNPTHVALSFVLKNNLLRHYLPTLKEFLEKKLNKAKQIPLSSHKKKKLSSIKEDHQQTENKSRVSPHIPYNGKPLSYNTGKVQQATAKIADINKGINQSLRLVPYELDKIKSLGETLEKNDPNYEYDPIALDIFPKLLKWPQEHLYPVIDIMRLLILQNSAANYFWRMTTKYKTINESIFGQLFEIANAENVTFVNQWLSLKLIANLFTQSCLMPLMLATQNKILLMTYKACENIFSPTTKYKDEQVEKILETIPFIMINFSNFWKHAPLEKHGMDLAFKILNTILSKSQKSNDKIILNSLIAVGTICSYKGKRMHITHIEKYQNHPNPQIAECAKCIVSFFAIK